MAGGRPERGGVGEAFGDGRGQGWRVARRHEGHAPRHRVLGDLPWPSGVGGDDRHAGRQCLHRDEAVRLGFRGREDETVEVGQDVGQVGTCPEPAHVRHRRSPRLERVEQPLLARDGATGDHQVQARVRLLGDLEGVEEHVVPLPSVDATRRADEGYVVGNPDRGAEAARVRWSVLVGVRGFVNDHEIVGMELRADRVRHADHRCREMPCEESLDRERRTRLDDDLTRVPDVRAPGGGRNHPSVPRMERVALDHVDLTSADEPCEASHRERPADGIRDPLADPV